MVMTMYYEDTLYPLQDKVLKEIDALKTPFYLTGGTALSRCYFHHRYSDDLDLFVNEDEGFEQETGKVLQSLKKFSVRMSIRSDTFCSILIDEILKVDFVNDTAAHVGEFSPHAIFSKIDNVENIVSNKISAIWSRDEAKDVVDLWVITKEREVDWQKIYRDVSGKASGIFPPLVAKKLETFPAELIEKVKWIPGKKPSVAAFRQDISSLIRDMLKIG